MITFSICLSDLPKEKITTAKNGKKYINLVMWENKQGQDQFGNTHSITISKEKGDESPNVYVGNGKDRSKSKPEKIEKAEVIEDDNDTLPF